MDIFTHTLMGVLVGIFTLTKLTPEAIILLWVMSYLPDFDVLLVPLQRIKKRYFLSHKAASHSFIIGLLFFPKETVSPLISSGTKKIMFGSSLLFTIFYIFNLRI